MWMGNTEGIGRVRLGEIGKASLKNRHIKLSLENLNVPSGKR